MLGGRVPLAGGFRSKRAVFFGRQLGPILLGQLSELVGIRGVLVEVEDFRGALEQVRGHVAWAVIHRAG